jgi:hypothetical protein
MSRAARYRLLATCLTTAACTALLAGCADEMPRDVQEATTPPQQQEPVQPDTDLAGPADAGRLPPGGYTAWLEDMRQELDVIRQQAREDRSEALALLQQLYVSRHEPLQNFFGEGGSAIASDAMAQAVERAGSLLRQLMRDMAETDVSAEAIDSATRAVQQALAEVEAEGTAAGLPPDAPRQ